LVEMEEIEMNLTKKEEAMLRGEHGSIAQKSMEILCALGDVFGAETMVEVGRGHIGCVALPPLGDPGIRYIEKIVEEGGVFDVPPTLNPIVLDLERWRFLKTPADVAQRQLGVVDCFRRMGAEPSFTCIPYLAGNLPRRGEHIAWCESSDIIFANSVCGAMTNREGVFTALASAFTGRTPKYGLHLKENRIAKVVVQLETELRQCSDYSAIGYYVGKIVGSKIPVFSNMPEKIGVTELKALGATLATTAPLALYHVVGVTPEAPTLEEALGRDKPEEEIVFGADELEETYESLRGEEENVDYVSFGCPHCTNGEIREIAMLLQGKKIDDDVDFLVSTCKSIRVMAERMGYVDVIESAGGVVTSDLCPMMHGGQWLEEQFRPESKATNSAKDAFSTESKYGISVHFGTTKDCINAATSGKWRPTQ
jgi:predicted aconitase